VAGERRLDVRGGTTVDSTGLEEMCELLWDPGTTVTYPACPIGLTPDLPSEGATCEPNAPGYEDVTCGGYDLALGVPCDDEVPVCNHGTIDFNGNVQVGYWDTSDLQLSTDSPSAPGGTCVDSLTIAAGTCETLVCLGMPATEHTLMVDPADALGECDERRLDNWSYHDGRTCSSVLAPYTEVQVYEAVCPNSSSPRWGLLTWSTQTPAGSSISFSAATAATVADLASAPAPTLLGTAEASPIDTQICTWSGPTPPCPVDVTGVLGLGSYQDPVLELTIEMGGSVSPTLEDWRLTYSCVIDE
jgi:hypothetical protein